MPKEPLEGVHGEPHAKDSNATEPSSVPLKIRSCVRNAVSESVSSKPELLSFVLVVILHPHLLSVNVLLFIQVSSRSPVKLFSIWPVRW